MSWTFIVVGRLQSWFEARKGVHLCRVGSKQNLDLLDFTFLFQETNQNWANSNYIIRGNIIKYNLCLGWLNKVLFLSNAFNADYFNNGESFSF